MQKVTFIAAGVAAATLGLAGTTAQAATLSPGVDVSATYAQDYFRDIDGGLKRGGGAPGRIDLSATIDGRAWGGSTDNVFYMDLLDTFGSSISGQVGDLQGLDNNEAYNTFKVFGAWYQHDFGNSGFSTRLGLQDYNALFDVIDAAGVFINSSFGLEPTISQLPVSTFPTTTLGAVLRWRSPRGLYLMGGVYDGKPGLAGHPAGTHIDLRSGDGILAALETGVSGGQRYPYKLAVGGWYRTSHYTDPAGQPQDRNHGLYVIGQQRLLGGEHTPAVDAFLQFGSAQEDRNQIDRYIGVGFNVTGLVPQRPDDILGLGMARVHIGSSYRRNNPGSTDTETAVELTYQASISKRLMIQPDVQYIIDPGAQHGVANAWVVGARARLSW